MRYYLVNQNQEDTRIDFTRRHIHQQAMVYEGVIGDKSYKRWFRFLAGKIFVSSDQKTWKKLTKMNGTKKLVSQTEVLKIYAGYKPSGLAQSSAGSLVTQMPGKVIKVHINPGDRVKAGDTLFIIEAMKMENEIKSSVSGSVKSVNIVAGQAVESGFVLGEIEVDK